ELVRPLQRGHAALDEALEVRPRESVAGADQLAPARQEKLELGEERLGALGPRAVLPRPGVRACPGVRGARCVGAGRGARGGLASLAASAGLSRTMPRTTSLMRTIRTPPPCP